MANQALTPTAEEIAQARDVYAMVFRLLTSESELSDNPMMEDRAKIYALLRQYPAVGAMLDKLDLDAPMGFGSIDIGLPNDPTYLHVLLSPEEFLDFALKGEVKLDKDGYPAYTGSERLRG